MEKKIAGLLGAVAALGTLGAAQATPAPNPTTDALKADSYADLLEPIPNAARTLQALDEQAPAKSANADVKVAQFFPHHHHHHHYHHHHHHHHHGYRSLIPRVVVVPPRRYYHHHHHHHHHHHQYYR